MHLFLESVRIDYLISQGHDAFGIFLSYSVWLCVVRKILSNVMFFISLSCVIYKDLLAMVRLVLVSFRKDRKHFDNDQCSHEKC